MRFFDCKRLQLISGQELMGIQGFDLSQLKIAQPSYRLYNLMAGNAMTVSVVMACMVGLQAFALPSTTGDWKSVNKIVKDHKLEHKYKTPAAKLKYVQKVLKLEITYDENKNPGVVFNDEDPDVKKVKFGRRLSRSKVQSKEVGNAEEMEIEAEKASSAVACKMEEKGKDSWQNRCDVEHVGRRKATSIEDLRLLVATVTAEGIFKQKPGCRPVDVNNKAGKASALSEEWLKESATTDIGKEAKLAGQVLLEMLALAGSISESCRAAVGDVETAAHWKTTINSFSKDNAKTCIATIAEKFFEWQEDGALFLDFIRCAEPSPGSSAASLTLHDFREVFSEKELLLMQASSLNSFFDMFRDATSFDEFDAMLKPSSYHSDIARPGHVSSFAWKYEQEMPKR
eukprot:s721_g2.t1